MNIKGNFRGDNFVELSSYLTDTGTADAYAVAFRPAITAYSVGLKVRFKAANGNTGASTIDVNGLGTRPIKKNVSVALASGDILANQIVLLVFDGTNFQMASGAGGGGTSGYSGFSGPGGGTSGYSGYSGAGASGYSGFSGLSGYSGYSGSGVSGYSGFSGVGTSGYSGFSGFGQAGGAVTISYTFSTSTVDADPGNGVLRLNQATQNTANVIIVDVLDSLGSDWTDVLDSLDAAPGQVPPGTGQIRLSSQADPSKWIVFQMVDVEFAVGYRKMNVVEVGSSAASPFSNSDLLYLSFTASGATGASGVSGYSGFSGVGTSGYSGFSGAGVSGYSGFSGPSGYSGFSGPSGYSGFSGQSGYSGYSGVGTSGFSGFSGAGTSGFSGFSGISGYSGFSGRSGYSGYSGISGYSGFSSTSGYSGFSGVSGYSGFSGSGISGYSGYSGAGTSGYSGFSGPSGYSGYSGISGYSGYSSISGYSGFSGATTDTVTVTAAPGSDVTATGLKVTLTAGENLAFGDICYVKSDGTLAKANATLDSSNLYPVVAMALATITSGNPGSFLLLGIARNDAWNWTVGGVIYLATTAGTMTQTQPSGANNVIEAVGVATHADRMLFNPDPSWIVHT